MDGFLLLSDGTALDGELHVCKSPVFGWPAVNTAVVGFHQMLTDPCYRGALLAFTYPETGNTGASAASAESAECQPRALVARELCDLPSHHSARAGLLDTIRRAGAACLTGIDTRGLAVHLRRNGEMPAVIAPAGTDRRSLLAELGSSERPGWSAPQRIELKARKNAPAVAVIDLGMRNSFAGQLCRCCRPLWRPYDAAAEDILADGPDAVIVSDGPSFNLPPAETVETLRRLTGRVPLLACGLGAVALGIAAGCRASFLGRGHHGANYPVRNLLNGRIETTSQRHSVLLDRDSVENCDGVEVAFVNVNDGTVEGIRTRDGMATGYQPLLSPCGRNGVNPGILEFIEKI